MGDRKLNQSKVSYKKTLKALVKKANNKDRIEYFDSETSGAKDTQCNLGLCGEEFKSMQDGTHRKNGHHCPHDGRYFSIEGDVLEGVNLPKSSTDGWCWDVSKHHPRNYGLSKSYTEHLELDQ